MADSNLQTTPTPTSAPVMPSAAPSQGMPATSVVTPPASTPATSVVTPPTSGPAASDDYLDLDSIYDLDGDAGKTQATLSANAPVPTANLDSFRAQSGAAVADGAVDNQILADLKAKASLSSSPVAPAPVAPSVASSASLSVDEKDDEMFDLSALKNLSQEIKNQAAPATPVAPVTPVAPPTKLAETPENVEVDLDALVKEEAAVSPTPIAPVSVPVVKPVSEAAKIEAELEANTIDLDEELKEGEALPDLFESATPSAGKSSALSKIKLTKTIDGEEKRVAPVQKLMKTDTIYNRADKKELSLSSVSGDKKLKSPAEELSELTLEDWSRLGDIPSERAVKIKEKIASLGAKSIIDEVKGLNAWRSSQTHQAYLDLGVAAMLSEKSLEEIVSEQKDLNLEEWLTINQLNRELMI